MSPNQQVAEVGFKHRSGIPTKGTTVLTNQRKKSDSLKIYNWKLIKSNPFIVFEKQNKTVNQTY